MVSNSTDRFNGYVASLAVKVPCVVAATTNITLSGAQTIATIAVVTGDRVLVIGQTDPIENGIYLVTSGAWDRAPDFDGRRDATTNSLVLAAVAGGDPILYKVDTAIPFIIGEDAINFSVYLDPAVLGGVHTPWTSNRDAAGFELDNLTKLSVINATTGKWNISVTNLGALSFKGEDLTEYGIQQHSGFYVWTLEDGSTISSPPSAGDSIGSEFAIYGSVDANGLPVNQIGGWGYYFGDALWFGNYVLDAPVKFFTFHTADGEHDPLQLTPSTSSVDIGDGYNLHAGNFHFDGTQAVGAGQDNFVLTYDNGTGLISLEAGPDPVDPSLSEINVQNGNYTTILSDKGKTISKESGASMFIDMIPNSRFATYARPAFNAMAWETPERGRCPIARGLPVSDRSRTRTPSRPLLT